MPGGRIVESVSRGEGSQGSGAQIIERLDGCRSVLFQRRKDDLVLRGSGALDQVLLPMKPLLEAKLGQPLLYKGGDFALTDIPAAAQGAA